MNISKKIILTTINAKWIHPSLALRLLKANLGSLENSCEIIEFALRQPLAEKTQPLLAACPGILGVSVSIWNHTATLELLNELEKTWAADITTKPVIVLGGPEVSHLSPEAEIFKHADHIIRGEGENVFRTLCEDILRSSGGALRVRSEHIIAAGQNNLNDIKTAYRLYTNEDLAKKLIYVESSRGCPHNCEFCLSSVKDSNSNAVREFQMEQFLEEMDNLSQRGAKTFKFLDRTFNSNIKRAVRIMEFFLNKIEERKGDLVIHFEMAPSHFPPELREIISRFPPQTLRLEIGIQTLNTETASRIGRPSNPDKELETIRFLCEKTNAIIHADLIAGLPCEDLASFANGFNRLCEALCSGQCSDNTKRGRTEIQLGILKILPGTPVACRDGTSVMRYNSAPPYEVSETSAMDASDIKRIKNFARFWELIVNRGLIDINRIRQTSTAGVFEKFMTLSDSLLNHFGRNWGIDKEEMKTALKSGYL
ncbi:MAG: B12-binding domain-containing radical SAM protein [Treponema sp.]|nr:B12-binding domain-containing radical SAM protein [Treponema sp.]